MDVLKTIDLAIERAHSTGRKLGKVDGLALALELVLAEANAVLKVSDAKHAVVGAEPLVRLLQSLQARHDEEFTKAREQCENVGANLLADLAGGGQ